MVYESIHGDLRYEIKTVSQLLLGDYHGRNYSYDGAFKLSGIDHLLGPKDVKGEDIFERDIVKIPKVEYKEKTGIDYISFEVHTVPDIATWFVGSHRKIEEGLRFGRMEIIGSVYCGEKKKLEEFIEGERHYV